MDAIHDNNQRPGFIKVYRLWRGLADVGSSFPGELAHKGKIELADAEDAKQLKKKPRQRRFIKVCVNSHKTHKSPP